ncbi:MAG: hypothetical protein GY943_30120 [Chloroflexi bacterium]|nr:hypothetical protein [Chloroflexota bacterium]
MRFFRQIWEDIKQGENIDLYLVVPVAIVLALLNILGLVSAQLVEPLTLIILGLIAISLLGNRNTVKNLSKALKKNTSDIFYRDFPAHFKDDIENAEELWLVGITLTDFIRNHYSILEQKLRNGHAIKALLVHPNSPVIELAEQRNYRQTDVERARREAKDSLIDLANLRTIATNPENLHVRTTDQSLGYAAFGMNLESSIGIVYISHFAFKMEPGSEPKFWLRMKDGQWYSFYTREISTLWEHGIDWQFTGNA